MPGRVEVPHNALGRLRTILISQDVSRRDLLELRVTARERNLNARDFASFLEVADRLYGQFSPGGLRSYSRRPDEQLRIDAIEPGSIEITILQGLGAIIDSHPIIAIYILWRFLQQFGPFAKNIAEAFKEYEHGALIRDLRSRMRDEKDLASAAETNEVADAEVAAIARFLDLVFKNSQTSLKKAGQFARDQITEVYLRVKKGT